MKKRPMRVPHMLNEAYDYTNPVPFSRGTRLDFGPVAVLLISGTASVDEEGRSVHIGDLEGQVKRALSNVTELLKSEEMTWDDVVYTRFYLRDIDRDYQDLSKVRMAFFAEQNLAEYPASCCVEAKICRSELLVELEVIAVRDDSDS